jgi:RND family efflux transporter MFP subunit
MKKQRHLKLKRNYSTQIIFCLALLFIGVLALAALASMKETPDKAKQSKKALPVSVVEVKPENVPVMISGYGEAKALDVVSISSEISGKICKVHKKLEAGETLLKGELLFQIDETRYRSTEKELAAILDRLENNIKRLKIQHKLDQERYFAAKRNQELAKSEFKRLKDLFYKHHVGSKSQLDAAEQSLNASKDLAAQTAQAVKIYPYAISEANSELTEAMAKLEAAQEDLKRCKVYAPFDGRIKTVSAEVGQYVTAGQNITTLANDAVLEIQLALDSRDASKWLRFNSKDSLKHANWFTGLKKIDCKVYWTEDRINRYRIGQLHRVVRFNPKTRTLIVAVRIDSEKTDYEKSQGLPIVEGMFCQVEIPGKTMQNVFCLPGSAVSFAQTVYIADNQHLKTVPVEVVRIQGRHTFISAGLNPGDQVIVSRLVNPLEDTLLTTVPAGTEAFTKNKDEFKVSVNLSN